MKCGAVRMPQTVNLKNWIKSLKSDLWLWVVFLTLASVIATIVSAFGQQLMKAMLYLCGYLYVCNCLHPHMYDASIHFLNKR